MVSIVTFIKRPILTLALGLLLAAPITASAQDSTPTVLPKPNTQQQPKAETVQIKPAANLWHGYGPKPSLAAPETKLIPTIKIAKSKGWERNETPVAAPGFAVKAFARELEHPRWLYVLPNGDVLVAETNKPENPEGKKGIRGWFMNFFMEKAGANEKSANRITLLRDRDGDGVADMRTPFITNLVSPFGMALVGEDFYVANTDGIVRFPYRTGDIWLKYESVKVANLPGGPLNHHWTKSMVASPDGRFLYVGVGSNSNVGENSMAREEGRAAIHQIEFSTGHNRIYATGLRNPVGMDWQPQTGKLWVAVNERDELGDDLVPDYMTAVQESGFYGWPYSYFGKHVDERIEPARPELVARAIEPDYALGAHTASLGLVFYNKGLFPEKYKGGAFVGQHGSWNRSVPSGYKVIFVPFENGKPSGLPEEILTGFLNDKGEARGRPVGVAVDHAGALLVADDTGNTIWRVTLAAP